MNTNTGPHDLAMYPDPMPWSLAVVCDPDIGRMAITLATAPPDLTAYSEGLDRIASDLMDLAGPVARVPQLRHPDTYAICLPILTAIYQATSIVASIGGGR